MGLPFGLLHAKFRPVERRENETHWTNAYGKAGKGTRNRGTGSVLVGTQVLEQSLDLDADFLVSRLAPFDLLVQRIGRLWRHADTPRPASCTRAEAVILTDPSDDPDCPFPSAVYYPYVLARTYEVLRSLPTDRAQAFPGSVRELLERVYAKRDESGNPVLCRLQSEMEKTAERKLRRPRARKPYGSPEKRNLRRGTSNCRRGKCWYADNRNSTEFPRIPENWPSGRKSGFFVPSGFSRAAPANSGTDGRKVLVVSSGVPDGFRRCLCGCSKKNA